MLIGYLEVFTCRSEVDVPPAGARHALSEKGGFCPLSLSYSGGIRVYIGAYIGC